MSGRTHLAVCGWLAGFVSAPPSCTPREKPSDKGCAFVLTTTTGGQLATAVAKRCSVSRGGRGRWLAKLCVFSAVLELGSGPVCNPPPAWPWSEWLGCPRRCPCPPIRRRVDPVVAGPAARSREGVGGALLQAGAAVCAPCCARRLLAKFVRFAARPWRSLPAARCPPRAAFVWRGHVGAAADAPCPAAPPQGREGRWDRRRQCPRCPLNL